MALRCSREENETFCKLREGGQWARAQGPPQGGSVFKKRPFTEKYTHI